MRRCNEIGEKIFKERPTTRGLSAASFLDVWAPKLCPSTETRDNNAA
jgi:uncharacterized protein YeaO (DUF488 family)